ncbi:MAG: tRNA 2-selenouridine(34) synthase MnmH [Firmicutes bacterium]|nr:tRNA 2-selenouridine(34) synthase MnmH [Bacillota bacterium]
MNLLDVETYSIEPDNYTVIDVRTAAEYWDGSIPGSINVPVFNAEERQRIGKVYKRSPRAAKFVALDILAPKLSKFLRRIHGFSRGRTPLIVCWRGGMRSRATVDLLRMAGVPALQLAGGYRAYRRHIHNALEQFQLKPQLIVLKGKSGTGKTELIKELQSMGIPTLDLEGFAQHRGSAFGGFCRQQPRSQKTFDALLYNALNEHNHARFLIVEGESKRIGNIYLPDFFYLAMKKAPVIEVNCKLEIRIQRIVAEYAPKTHQEEEHLGRALERLQPKLGHDVHKLIKQYLDAGNYFEFVKQVLVQYYDKIYDFQLPGKEVIGAVDSGEIKKAATEIAALVHTIYAD